MRAVLRLAYARYVIASAVALGVDITVFLAALGLGAPPVVAAAAGYMTGLVVHWFMSSRVVFVGRLADKGGARLQQQGLFLGSALTGLGITMAIVGIGDLLGADPRLAKLAAVAISFQVTYILRRKIVFS